MNKQTMRLILATVTSLLGLVSTQSAQAATTWNGSWNYNNCSAASVSYGNSYSCTDSIAPADAKMGITAWSSDLSPSVQNFVAAAVAPWGSSAGFGIVNTEECAGKSNASGWSICDPGTGPHAADNVGQLEGFLLNFTNPGETVSVALNSVTMGWNGTDNPSGSYTDSDISVFYWVGGSGGPTMGSIGASGLPATAGSTANGWKLLNHYSNVGSAEPDTMSFGNTGAGAVSSSWWFVSASNSASAIGNDAFKLLTVAGTGTSTGKTPEPGSLALAGLALFGMVGLRRKAKQQA